MLRPAGLNTVELLKVASSSLNIGPAHAMQVGELRITAAEHMHVRLVTLSVKH